VVYHCLDWLGLVELHNLGLYGVYVFFVLSGASMVLAYDTRIGDAQALGSYLAKRYIRLAPLYALVCTVVTLQLAADGASIRALAARVAMNVSLLFGFVNPGETALATGGWSLGIEFLFYLLFPAMCLLSRLRRFGLIVAVGFGLQILCVNLTLANHAGLGTNWVRYTQLGSFVGYFLAGVWIGRRQVNRARIPRAAAILLLALSSAALLLCHGATADLSLIGIRGVALAIASVVLVLVTAQLGVGSLRRFAGILGNASYPLYLLHPLVFAAIRSPLGQSTLGLISPVTSTAATLGTSLLLALAVHRWFEKPVIAWATARLRAWTAPS